MEMENISRWFCVAATLIRVVNKLALRAKIIMDVL